MKTENPFKRAAAAIAGIVIACTGSALNAAAVESTTAENTSAEETSAEDTSTVSTAADTQASTEPSSAAVEEEKAEKEETEWYKAELDEYDESLSLISYEVSPESAEDGKSTAKTRKNKKDGEPTPVELNVTGGFVGDIPWFESEPVIDAQPGEFAIVTYGWGHGVGMSQNGANYYAMYSGWTYQDILFHYYPGTYLMNTGLAETETLTIGGVTGDVLSLISQVVFNEVGCTMSYEAIKAQAVAAYTYCKYNGNNGNDLILKPHPPQNVVDACAEVLGQALYYDDDYALTMFTASSGGVTANCYEVFWADLPYLRSVPSDYDAAYDPHYGTVTYIDDFQLRNMIQKAYGLKLSDDPTQWLQPSYSAETGYVTSVNIDNQITVRGYEFKLALGLKCSKFNVFYCPRPEGEKIPDGSSTPTVVDPDFMQTPAIIYSNNQPTDIGGYQPPVEEPTEETTLPEEYVTEPYEEPTEGTSEEYPTETYTGEPPETTEPSSYEEQTTLFEATETTYQE